MVPVVVEIEKTREDHAGLPYCLTCLACWVGCCCLWPLSLFSLIFACLADRFKRRGDDSYKVCSLLSIVISLVTIVVAGLSWVFFYIYIFPLLYRYYWRW